VSSFFLQMIKILGFPSCLHKNSSSQQLLHLIKAVGGVDWILDVADLSGLPLFNRDIESLSFRKSQVESFRNHVEEADAFLFCASEFPLGYAYSVSSPLKNAIDWAVTEPNLFTNKPAAFIGEHFYHSSLCLISVAVDGFETSGINCYHLRQLAILCGLNCIDNYQLSLTSHDCDSHTGFVLDSKVCALVIFSCSDKHPGR
jgi:chromate reductase, NAD(P)H dehydrogenase (quinone)